MSSDDNFIARWSRLKRSSAHATKARAETRKPDARQGGDADAVGHPATPREAHPNPEPPFDPATLPPIESIVAGSDIRAFLRKGVPAELTKAALRRAWTADPAIRDFIGIAENQWDFTDPASIPGFGPLEATDGLPQLVAQAMGELRAAADAVVPAGDADPRSANRGASPTAAANPTPAAEPRPDADSDQLAAVPAASQHPADDSGGMPASRRGHGSALPR
jgi:hypothetical protein